MSKDVEFHKVTANLMVQDVNETVDYYKSNLNFDVIMTVPESGDLNWAMMSRGGVTLMFHEKRNLVGEYPLLADRAPGSGLTLFVNVDDADGLHDAIKDKVDICVEPHATFYGTREFAIVDCNGFVLTFAES